MRRGELNIAVSWILWGAGYYAYYPFLSIFLVRFMPETRLGLFYTILTAAAVPIPILGAALGKAIGVKRTMTLGMALSGLGLMTLGFADSMASALFSLILYYLFFLSLPHFYAYMSSMGRGTIARIWGISILPSIIMPTIGGYVATAFSLEMDFLLSGAAVLISAAPLITINDLVPNHDGSPKTSSLIPFLVILPIALASPYVYLVDKMIYGLSYSSIGIIATIAELMGMISALMGSRIKRNSFLAVNLGLFSLIGLLGINYVFAVFYGFWESIIPLSLEGIKARGPRDYAVINSMQQLGWLSGYISSAALNEPIVAIQASSAISILMAILVYTYGKRNAM